jgi:glycine/D-amino acid oxidase-like deaminating enzyme
MRTRYGLSPWVEGVPGARRPDYPRLRGEQNADVVVVGGGLTGCATAYACAVAGLKAIVVEAARIGQGTAGRGTGLLLPDPGPAFRDLAAAHGLRAARHAFESWRRASLDAAAQLRRLRIPCALAPKDVLVVAASSDERLLRREHDARTEAGLPVRWLTQQALGRITTPESAASALRFSDAFALDPYRACLGLARAAAARGALLAERTTVRAIKPGSKRVEVTHEGGVIHAGTVIVTTGVATSLFKPLQRHFKPRETYLVLTEPLAAPVRKQVVPAELVLRRNAPPLTVVRTSDHRLLVAGADQGVVAAKNRDATRVQRTGQLMYELLLMYPAISGLQPAFGWDATYGVTADGVMYIGPHRNYPRHLFALGGQSSVTGAFLAARILARTVRGQVEKGDEVFGWADRTR